MAEACDDDVKPGIDKWPSAMVPVLTIIMATLSASIMLLILLPLPLPRLTSCAQ